MPAMTVSVFPSEARYLSVIGNIRPEAGGQTRLTLLRHRLFLQHTDIDLPLVTYNPVPSYDAVRTTLLGDGRLLPESRLLNLHEELRVIDTGVGTGRLPRVGDSSVDDVADGYAWRRRWYAGDIEVAWDYLRPDGSRYARTAPDDPIGLTYLIDRDENVVHRWDGLGGLWRWWTEQLAGDAQRVFLLSDSRFVAQELCQLDERFLVMHQMHNPHLSTGSRGGRGGSRSWHSGVSATYRPSMDSINRYGGLMSLTDRQREDVARRYGRTTNLYVVPNPVETPAVPVPAPQRVTGRIVMTARLEQQKRLDRALSAFALVQTQVPDATLEIYGDGPQLKELKALAADLEVAEAVTFHGFDPAARDAWWTADLGWLTSDFEGYPLSTLEGMARGCPVVAVDVKYGPREQVDETNGVLVPAGDIEAIAAETVALLHDRDRLERLRDGARTTALAHGHDRFLGDWANAVADAADRADRRVLIGDVRVEGVHVRGSVVTLDGTVQLDASHAPRPGDEPTIRWQAWSPDRDELIDLPLEVSADGDDLYSVKGSVDLTSVLPGAKQPRVRLAVTWENSAHHVRIADLDLSPGWRRLVRRVVNMS